MTPDAAWRGLTETLSGWGYGYFSEIIKTNSNQRAMTKKLKTLCTELSFKNLQSCMHNTKNVETEDMKEMLRMMAQRSKKFPTQFVPFLKPPTNKNNKYPCRSHQNLSLIH